MLTSDQQQVLYALGSTFDATLYTIPIAGGVPVLLGLTSDSASATFVANDTKVAYSVDTNLQNITALNLVSVQGGAPQTISDPGGSGRPATLESADQRFLVFNGRVNEGSVFRARFELRSATSSGGLPRVLSPFGLSPTIAKDDQQVVYLQRTRNANDDIISRLSIVGINGGPETDLTGNLPFMSSVTSYQISPDGEFAVFRADKDIFDKFELYAVKLPIIAPEEDDELCVPIKAQNNKIALICL